MSFQNDLCALRVLRGEMVNCHRTCDPGASSPWPGSDRLPSRATAGLDTDGPSANFLASCWKFSIGRIVMTKHTVLSRRERQIMDIIYQRGQATAAEVMEDLPDPPSYSAVRALLRVLEEKGHVRHKHDGPRYVFYPTVSRDRARQSALKQVVGTFFEDSTEQAVATLLDMSAKEMSEVELDRLAELIEQARKEGR